MASDKTQSSYDAITSKLASLSSGGGAQGESSTTDKAAAATAAPADGDKEGDAKTLTASAEGGAAPASADKGDKASAPDGKSAEGAAAPEDNGAWLRREGYKRERERRRERSIETKPLRSADEKSDTQVHIAYGPRQRPTSSSLPMM